MKSSVPEFLFYSFLVLGMILIAFPSFSDSKEINGFVKFGSPRRLFRRAYTESASATTPKGEKTSGEEMSNRKLVRWMEQMLYRLGIRPGEDIDFNVKDKYAMNVNWNIQVGDVNYLEGMKRKGKSKSKSTKEKGKEGGKKTTGFKSADRK